MSGSPGSTELPTAVMHTAAEADQTSLLLDSCNKVAPLSITAKAGKEN